MISYDDDDDVVYLFFQKQISHQAIHPLRVTPVVKKITKIEFLSAPHGEMV
jgi:hypothetical protein